MGFVCSACRSCDLFSIFYSTWGFFFFKCRDHFPSLMSLGAAVVPCRGSACPMAPFRAPSARGVVCVVGGSEIWELKEVKFVFGS